MANDDGAQEIERALVRHEWVPSENEIALGEAFFHRQDLIERDLEHVGLVQSLALEARLIGEVEQELLPVWQGRARGRMLNLLQLYVTEGQHLLPYAETLLAAWEASPPDPPTTEAIAAESKRLRVPAPEAEANLRDWGVRQWEDRMMPESERRTVLDVWARLGSVRSIIAAAATGNLAY